MILITGLAASFFGTVFTKRSKDAHGCNLIELQWTFDGTDNAVLTALEVLEELEFTSERMRQSVITKDLETGAKRAHCKDGNLSCCLCRLAAAWAMCCCCCLYDVCLHFCVFLMFASDWYLSYRV